MAKVTGESEDVDATVTSVECRGQVDEVGNCVKGNLFLVLTQKIQFSGCPPVEGFNGTGDLEETVKIRLDGECTTEQDSDETLLCDLFFSGFLNFEGRVAGREGKIRFRVQGNRVKGEDNGTFTCLSATGDLEGLCCQGAFGERAGGE